MARDLLARGDKSRALLALRRKKFQESLLAKTDAQLAQLEALTARVEFALIQKDIVFGLEQGTRVLGEIHAEMGGIENVEKLMGENAEAIAYQKVRPFHLPTTLSVACTRGFFFNPRMSGWFPQRFKYGPVKEDLGLTANRR